MERKLQQSNPLLDASDSKDDSSHETPSPAPSESSIPAVRARNSFWGAVHAFGQDHKSLVYIILASILVRFGCGISGGSNCGDLTYGISVLLTACYIAAMYYAGELPIF